MTLVAAIVAALLLITCADARWAQRTQHTADATATTNSSQWSQPPRRQSRVYRVRAAINGQPQMPVVRLSSTTTSTMAPTTLAGVAPAEAPYGVRASSANATSSRRAKKLDFSGAHPHVLEISETPGASGSISASSPTLQLTAASANVAQQTVQAASHQVVLAKQRMGAQASSAPALVTLTLAATQQPPTQAAAADTLLEAAAGVSQTTNQTPDASSGHSISPHAQQASTESILSLIDEFDSKIITNRTRGKCWQPHPPA